MAARPEADLSASTLATLRADYESGACALTTLARRFSLSPAALRAMARRLNFGARPPIRPFQRRGDAKSALPDSDPVKPVPVKNAAGKDVPGKTARTAATRKTTPKRKTTAANSPRREPAPAARADTEPARGDPPRPLKPLDLQATAERLRHAAERELVKINDRLEAGEDVERHARSLASLVKSLADLARLAEARAAPRDDDARPWTLDDLNAEIERQVGFLAESEPPASPAEPTS